LPDIIFPAESASSGNESASTMDVIRMVFDRLHAAGTPDDAEREQIYAACRAEVAASHSDAAMRERALTALEKAIRRQDMQALYEETIRAGDADGV
jgi:hypothetical protein